MALSELGYPGEGPAEKLRMCTYNVNGLNGNEGQKCKTTNWANRKALDVLFMQEHNLGVGRHKDKAKAWRNMCRRAFSPYAPFQRFQSLPRQRGRAADS